MLLPWKMIFICLLFMSPFIVMSASSWLVAWMGLEINILSFLVVSLNSKSPRNSEAIFKYFLVQALASALLITSAFSLSPEFSSSDSFLLLITLTLSILLKLGAAPLHMWVPQIIDGCSWVNLSLILIWQKIAPFMLLSNLILTKTKHLLSSFIFLSALTGAILGLTQTSSRKILAFSSINHMGWMLAALMMSPQYLIWYFFFYSIVLILLVINFKISGMTTISSSNFLSNKSKTIFFSSLLSLGGLPPFLGFLPKWMIVSNLITTSLFMASFLVMSSLLTLAFYIRLSLSSFMNKTTTTSKFSTSLPVWPLMINIFGLTVISLL